MTRRVRTPGTSVLTPLVLTALVLTALGMVGTGPAQAARVPGCTAAELRLVRLAPEAATGHRYDRFRITNVGDRTCRLYGYPAFRFRNAAGARIGYASAAGGVKAYVVRLAPGENTRIVVGTVAPPFTLARECHARRAASVDVRLAFRRHVYHRPLQRQVCTTKRYRPTSYPVGF